jgi:iron complex outermembrane recepter protein
MDVDGSPLNVLEVTWNSSTRQWAQDLRISGDTDRMNFVAGLYYSNEELEFLTEYDFLLSLDGIVPFDPTLQNSGFYVNQQYDQSRESSAAYGQINYQLSDAWVLQLGLRYTQDKNAQLDFASYAGDYSRTPVLSLIPGPGLYDPSAKLDERNFTDKEWTGKIGLEYHPSDDTLLYASFSQGYRSGGFTGGAFLNEAELTIVDPELIDAYELGTKMQLLNNRVQINAAAFYYDYTNQQFVNIVGVSPILTNAGESTITGIDLEVLAKPTDTLTLSIGLGVLDSEYKKLALIPQSGNQPVDLAGNELISAPNVNFNFGLEHRFEIRNVGTLTSKIDTAFVDKQWFSAFNDDSGYQNIGADDYWLSNASLNLELQDGQYRVGLWVKNIENKEYKVYGVNFDSVFGLDYLQYGKPRTYGMDFTWLF